MESVSSSTITSFTTSTTTKVTSKVTIAKTTSTTTRRIEDFATTRRTKDNFSPASSCSFKSKRRFESERERRIFYFVLLTYFSSLISLSIYQFLEKAAKEIWAWYCTQRQRKLWLFVFSFFFLFLFLFCFCFCL